MNIEIPDVFNYRIVYKYNVSELLDVYDTEHVINIKNYPIIMTLELLKPKEIKNIPNDETETEIDSDLEDNNEISNNLICNICKKTYKSQYTLKIHKEIHNKNRIYRYNCKLCNFKTDVKGRYIKHLTLHDLYM
jgi:hypothetical protein